MPGFSVALTVPRANEPHLPTLLTQLRALDPTSGVAHVAGTENYIVKKATAWTTPQRTAATNTILNAPDVSPGLVAQDTIDRWPPEYRALVDTLLDEINILRAAVVPPLPARTLAQAITTLRNKAGAMT